MHFDLGIAFAPPRSCSRTAGEPASATPLYWPPWPRRRHPSRVDIGYAYVLACSAVMLGPRFSPATHGFPSMRPGGPGFRGSRPFLSGRSSLYGGGGSLTGGATQQLLGQIDVRILAFGGPDGRPVEVPENAAAYKIEGDSYLNPGWESGSRNPRAGLSSSWTPSGPKRRLSGWTAPKAPKPSAGSLSPALLSPEEALRQALGRQVPAERNGGSGREAPRPRFRDARTRGAGAARRARSLGAGRPGKKRGPDRRPSGPGVEDFPLAIEGGGRCVIFTWLTAAESRSRRGRVVVGDGDFGPAAGSVRGRTGTGGENHPGRIRLRLSAVETIMRDAKLAGPTRSAPTASSMR